MTIFREFVKYEQMIVDFAMDMHQKQYEAAKKGHFERYTLENILAGLEEASVGMWIEGLSQIGWINAEENQQQLKSVFTREDTPPLCYVS